MALFKLTGSKCKKVQEKMDPCIYKANKHGLWVTVL